MAAVIVVEAVAIILLGVLVAGLLRSHAEILRALHRVGVRLDDDHEHGAVPFRVQPGVAPPRPADTPAHDLAGVSPDDEAIVVGVAGAAHPTLLAFLSSGCATCAGFWDAFAAAPPLPAGTRLVIVTKDPDEESQSEIRRLAPHGVAVVMSSAAWGDYEVPGSPYFVYVDGRGGRVVGEGAATTWPQVASLLGQAVADAATPAQVPAGAGDAGGWGHGAEADRGGWGRGGEGDRAERVDRELLAAGIHPGHPSLYGAADAEPAEGD